MSLHDGIVELLFIIVPALVIGWVHRTPAARRRD
jgi:hypothetical protein